MTKYQLAKELGQACSDEVAATIDQWVKVFDNPHVSDLAYTEYSQQLWQVAKAELMDNIYAVIKKYQGGKHETK